MQVAAGLSCGFKGQMTDLFIKCVSLCLFFHRNFSFPHSANKFFRGEVLTPISRNHKQLLWCRFSKKKLFTSQFFYCLTAFFSLRQLLHTTYSYHQCFLEKCQQQSCYSHQSMPYIANRMRSKISSNFFKKHMCCESFIYKLLSIFNSIMIKILFKKK